jgi:uncharacterized protein YndB with AHSA1/START domain
MKLLLYVVATMAGLLFGGISVSLVQLISSVLYAAPPEVDLNQPEQLASWVKTLPVAAFMIVLASWAVGPWIGTFSARLLSPNRAAIPAIIVWLLFGAATVSMLIMIPHPGWMWPAGLLAWFLFGLMGMALSAPRQSQITIVRTILAPVKTVFQTISRPERFSQAIPDIIQTEILSSQQYGVGTRFRETRTMNGRTAVAEMEVAEQVEDQLIRLDAEMGGTLWSTRFTLRPQGPSVDLEMQMTAQAKNMLSRLITPMLMSMVTKAMVADMDHVKAYCEKTGTS